MFERHSRRFIHRVIRRATCPRGRGNVRSSGKGPAAAMGPALDQPVGWMEFVGPESAPRKMYTSRIAQAVMRLTAADPTRREGIRVIYGGRQESLAGYLFRCRLADDFGGHDYLYAAGGRAGASAGSGGSRDSGHGRAPATAAAVAGGGAEPGARFGAAAGRFDN